MREIHIAGQQGTGRTLGHQIPEKGIMADENRKQTIKRKESSKALRLFFLILIGIFAVILLAGQKPGAATAMMQTDPVTDLAGTWTLEGETCVTALPGDLPYDTLLQLPSMQFTYTVSIDGKEVCKVETDNAASAFHWISLPENSAGKTLQIQGEASGDVLLQTLNASSALGTRAAFQWRLARENLYALFFFLFCVCMAVFLLYASIRQRRKQEEQSMSSGLLGLLLLCSGIWALTDSQLLQLVTANVNLGAMVSVICFFLMPVLFLEFLESLLPDARVFRDLEILFLFNMALGLFLHLTGIVSAYTYIFTNHLLLIVMMLLVTRALSKDKAPIPRKIRTGCFVYFVCEITTLVVYYLYPTSRWYARILCIGVLVLSLYCLSAWFNRYLEDLSRIAQNELFKKLAYQDSLTGLGNRAAYERDWLRVLPGEDAALVMFDINGLKIANDTYGHTVGDQLIQAATGEIQKIFGKDGTVYRLGGDEFLALLTGSATEKLDHCLEEVHKRLEGSLTIDHGIPVWAACGAASTKEAPAADLFRLADQRMYEKKRQMEKTAP